MLLKIIKINIYKISFPCLVEHQGSSKGTFDMCAWKEGKIWKPHKKASSSNGSNPLFHTLQGWIYLLYFMSWAAFTKVMHYSSISKCLIENNLLHV